MRRPMKRTFTPTEKVKAALKDVPSLKVSERINQLLMKGIEEEREEKMKAEYERFNAEMGLVPNQRSKVAAASVLPFNRSEDEDDSDQDLI